jgi:hypothetical protein
VAFESLIASASAERVLTALHYYQKFFRHPWLAQLDFLNSLAGILKLKPPYHHPRTHNVVSTNISMGICRIAPLSRHRSLTTVCGSTMDDEYLIVCTTIHGRWVDSNIT